MAHLADYDTKRQYTATVKKTRRLSPDDTDEVRELLLEVKQPEFKCKVDQSFGVLVNIAGDFGNTIHHRLYSVADLPAQKKKKTQLTVLVRRCFFVDDFNGERYDGIGSNYLCDRQVGDEISITGPFELPFSIPEGPDTNLILIGLGTGIAPFRALIKHIYKHVEGWQGRILLFHGARSGLELLYANDKDDDLTNYYDEETFESINALSPRPLWNDPVILDQAIEDRSQEILEMLSLLNTYIYVAGHDKIKKMLDKAFANILGSQEKWETRRAELIEEKRWAELIY